MQQIKNCGYMTSSTEVNSVLGLIKKYNLTMYDHVAGAVSEPQGNLYPVPTTVIKLNSKGDAVRWLQYQLNAKGGYKLTVDGIAGNLTIGAVLDWQKKHPPLEVDGIAGPKTIETLK
jgi:peptidoglycan hydrolase-like protein with peptidoglycan-binding domain